MRVIPSFLTSALDGGEGSASRPYRFTPGEKALGTGFIDDWEGPKAGLDAVEKRKILTSRKLNPNRPVRSPSLQ
jgi:hypothetical protein